MCRTIYAFLLAVAAAFCLPATTRADNFSFSVGSGYGGHGHHHHGCYGPAWGFSYWNPGPRYYYYGAPPPVYVQPQVIQQPVIVQPAPIVTNAYVPPVTVTSNPLPTPPTRAAANGSPVVIRNTNGKGAPVSFLVDERSEELRDGQTRSYSGSTHVVEFDRGGELGTARYEVTGGLYGFTVGENGWELVRDSGSSSTRTASRPTLKRNELPEGQSR